MSHFHQWLNQPISVGFPPSHILDQYLIAMEEHGYDDVAFLCSLTEAKLEAMFGRVGITKEGHKEMLLILITKARAGASYGTAGPVVSFNPTTCPPMASVQPPLETATNTSTPTRSQNNSIPSAPPQVVGHNSASTVPPPMASIQPPLDTTTNIFTPKSARSAFISNLPLSITPEDIRSHFGNCGRLVRVHIPHLNKKDPDSYAPYITRIAVIDFETPQGLQNALQLHRTILNGRDIEVSVARDRKVK